MVERQSGGWPTCESLGLEPGQRWAFLVRSASTGLEEVTVLRCGSKRPSRVLVGFVSDEFEGRREWVAPVRLVCRWDEAPGWIERAACWRNARRLSTSASEVELTAACHVVAAAYPGRHVVADEDGSDAGVLIIRNYRSFDPADVVDAMLEVRGVFVDVDRLVVPWPGAKRLAQALAGSGDLRLLNECLVDEAQVRLTAVLDGEASEPRLWPKHRTEREHSVALAAVYDVIRSWWSVDVVEHADDVTMLQLEIKRQRQQIVGLLASLLHTMRAT